MVNLNEEELINDINKILNELNTLGEEKAIKDIIDNLEVFKQLKERLDTLSEKYLIKKMNEKKKK